MGRARDTICPIVSGRYEISSVQPRPALDFSQDGPYYQDRTPPLPPTGVQSLGATPHRH